MAVFYHFRSVAGAIFPQPTMAKRKDPVISGKDNFLPHLTETD